ncbi:hypothetical protein PVAP13_4KG353888 [Panicum virgatum]|uniref:Uncharacterized protein n=1 Tax=Panicum virgatum TaxID=38727 RepID=A0A8T0TW39_PANVG|nr:hypothetical protein PVAP13_4KG353888 [Panicum virgatum]
MTCPAVRGSTRARAPGLCLATPRTESISWPPARHRVTPLFASPRIFFFLLPPASKQRTKRSVAATQPDGRVAGHVSPRGVDASWTREPWCVRGRSLAVSRWRIGPIRIVRVHAPDLPCRQRIRRPLPQTSTHANRPTGPDLAMVRKRGNSLS